MTWRATLSPLCAGLGQVVFCSQQHSVRWLNCITMSLDCSLAACDHVSKDRGGLVRTLGTQRSVPIEKVGENHSLLAAQLITKGCAQSPDNGD